MKNNLKIGQSFEVVEVLDYGFSNESLFKIGGFTIGVKHYSNLIKCIGNGSMEIISNASKRWMTTCYLNMRINSDVKPIGKLTITKIK